MLNLLKLIKLFIFSFVIFTFLTSIFTSGYYEHYEKSETAVYNLEVANGLHEKIEGHEDYCAALKHPVFGMTAYYRLLPLSSSLVKISALFLLKITS